MIVDIVKIVLKGKQMMIFSPHELVLYLVVDIVLLAGRRAGGDLPLDALGGVLLLLLLLLLLLELDLSDCLLLRAGEMS